MPEPVIKYTCSFKCGRAANASSKNVEEHETKCWNNPTNQTCKTCKFEHYFLEVEDTGVPEWGSRTYRVRDCKHPEGGKITEEAYERLHQDTMHILPVINCAFWISKK